MSRIRCLFLADAAQMVVHVPSAQDNESAEQEVAARRFAAVVHTDTHNRTDDGGTCRVDERSGSIPRVDIRVVALRVRDVAWQWVLADETSNRRIIPALIIVVETCRSRVRLACKSVSPIISNGERFYYI